MLKGTWQGRAFQSSGFKFLRASNEAFSSKFADALCYFNGIEGSKKASENEGVSNLKSSRTNPITSRQLTNALIAVNMSAYIADLETYHKTHTLWGAKEFLDLNQTHMLRGTWWERTFQFNGFKFLQSSNEAFSSKFADGLYYCNGGEGSKKASWNEAVSKLKSSITNLFTQSPITSALIAINVLAYTADLATDHTLRSWGAKDNHLISEGQWWRLITCTFLHANPLHLLVNCHALYKIGPVMEIVCGPKRYLAVYFASGIAGSGLSYCFTKGNAVGASGAISGLVGSYVVYLIRHSKYMDGGGIKYIESIADCIALNVAFGLSVDFIDNWGHLGGLLGGAAATWLLGPAYKYEHETTADGTRIYIDRPPISRFVKTEAKRVIFKSKS